MSRFLLVSLLLAACLGLSAAAGVGVSSSSSDYRLSSSSSAPRLSSSSQYPALSSSSAAPSSTAPPTTPSTLSFYPLNATAGQPLTSYNYSLPQAYAAYHPGALNVTVATSIALNFQAGDATHQYVFVAYLVEKQPLLAGGATWVGYYPTAYDTYADLDVLAAVLNGRAYTFQASAVPAQYFGTSKVTTTYVFALDVNSTGYQSYLASANQSYITLPVLQQIASGWTQLDVNLVVTQQPVAIATVASAIYASAGNSTNLAPFVLLAASVQDSITLTASVDIGYLSAAVFSGPLDSVQAALSSWMYYAPLVTPPSAYYNTTDAHYIGNVLSQAVAFLTISLSSPSTAGTATFTFPITIALTNQPPSVAVRQPANLTGLAVLTSSALYLPLVSAGLVFADVDGFNFAETVVVSAVNGGMLCWRAGLIVNVSESCSSTYSTTGTLAALNNFPWNLTYFAPATARTDYIVVTLNDNGASGSARLSNYTLFPITVNSPPMPGMPVVTIAAVNVAQYGTTALQATWPMYTDLNVVNPPIAYYTVSWGTNGDAILGQLNVSTAGKGNSTYTATITGLLPGTLYWVEVQAGNAYGLSWPPSPVHTDYAWNTYPVTATTCGSTQYCGAQWTVPIAPAAPSLRVAGDGLSANMLYVSIAAANNQTASDSYYQLSYASLGATGAVGNFTSPRTLYGDYYGNVAASLSGFKPSTSYVVKVAQYDYFFGIYSLAVTVSYATMAAAPTIAALTVSDPNGTATATTFLNYHTGLLLSITFSASVQIASGSLNAAQLNWSSPVGSLSAWSQTAGNTFSAWVLDASTASVQLGLLTVYVDIGANVTAISPASYPANSSSPLLTGSFGTYDFGANAVAITTTAYSTAATTIALNSSLVSLTGTDGSYSYVLSLVTPSVAYLTSTAVNTLAQANTTVFAYGGGSSKALVGGSLAALQASLAGLSIVVPQYYSGPVSYSVLGYTLITGTYTATSSRLGQITITPTYHTPQINYNATSSIVTVPVRPGTLALLTSYVSGLSIYDVDADRAVNFYADTASAYTLTVSWFTQAPSSYLGYGSVYGTDVTPESSTLATLSSTSGGASSFTAVGSLPSLQQLLSYTYISSFKLDAMLRPSTLNITVTNAQGMSATARFIVLQDPTTVPATAVTAVYLLPNQQSLVALLNDSVVTPLATAQTRFNASQLFASSAFGVGATCAFLAASPINAFTVGAASAYIQCSFGTGATFAIDSSNVRQLSAPLTVVAGSSVLQRVVNGQLSVASNTTQYVKLLPGVLASVYGTPSFTITGSSTISYCPNQTLSLSVGSSTGAGFGTTYFWIVTSDALPENTTMNAALTAGLVDVTQPTLTIPNVDQFAAFASGTFTFQLSVINLVRVQAVNTFTVVRQGSPAPALLGATTQTNAITDLILLSFTPQLGACFTSANTTILYSWSSLSAGVQLDPLTAYTSTLGFVKPYLTNGLRYGQSYQFQLTASLKGVSNSSVSRVITLSISDLPLVAGIYGAAVFQVGSTAGFTLSTVGAAQLPNSSYSSTNSSWSCVNAAGAQCGITDSGLPQLNVPAGALPAGATYTFTVTMIAYNSLTSSSQTSLASVQVSVIAGTPVAISITAYKGAALVQGSVIVNDFSSLRLAATASANATYMWSCVGCPSTFALNPNTSNTAALSLNPNNVAGFWTALATYQFRVDVTPIGGSLAASFSSIVVTVNTPPAAPSTEALVITGPGSGATQLAGFANGVDVWTLTVAQLQTKQSGWTGSGVLSYQFFYIDATGNTNYLTSVSPALSFTSPLPLGYGALHALPVGVIVYDSNGGQTSYQVSGSSAPVVQAPTNVSSAQLLGNLLTASQTLSPSGFLSAVVSIASAATSVNSANSSSTPVNATEQLQQRLALLNAVASNLASVSPALALQAVSSIVGGGAVSDPAALSKAASLLSSVLTNALSDPSFTATPTQLGGFFGTISNIMNSNKARATTAGRRLLQVTSGPQETTQQTADALFAKAMDAISTNFIGAAAAPAAQAVPTAGALVFRAAYTQGLPTATAINYNNISLVLSAGSGWLAGNALPTDGSSAFDIQVGILTPDPLVSLLTSATMSFAGVTVWFDVVGAGSNQSQALMFANSTDAPALKFNVNDVPAMAALLSTANKYVQCVQWKYTTGYTAVVTSAVDSTGAFTCQPATPATYVSYAVATAAPQPGASSSSSSGGASESSSSSTGVNTNMFAYLFSGYSGSRSMGGYYFWMAVSIALCLLFPVFVLTYKPSESLSSAAAAKQRALQQPSAAPANQQQVHVDLGAGEYAASAPAKDTIAAQPAQQADEPERERQATVDNTMDYGDVNALKRNVYSNEEKDASEGADADEVGFVIHQ